MEKPSIPPESAKAFITVSDLLRFALHQKIGFACEMVMGLDDFSIAWIRIRIKNNGAETLI